MNKLVSLSVVGMFVLGALVLAGCAAKEAVHPISSYVVPDFSTRNIKTIALVPICELTMSGEAPEVVPRVLRQHVSGLTSYRFLSQEDVAALAQSNKVSDAYNDLVSAWQKKGEIRTEAAISVGQAVGVDALLFTDVYIWVREWVQANTKGTSQTQVAIKMSLISTKNGEKLWEAADDQVVSSIEYDPSSKIGVHVDEFGRASALYGGLPAPPTFDEVVPRVLDAIFKVFP